MCCRNYTGTVSHVFVDRFVILCPYLGESTIREPIVQYLFIFCFFCVKIELMLA